MVCLQLLLSTFSILCHKLSELFYHASCICILTSPQSQDKLKYCGCSQLIQCWYRGVHCDYMHALCYYIVWVCYKYLQGEKPKQELPLKDITSVSIITDEPHYQFMIFAEQNKRVKLWTLKSETEVRKTISNEYI